MEMTSRLDASFYVITRRRDRLLQRLACPFLPLSAWAEVNPPGRRLPTERDFILFEHCVYGQIRDVPHEDCWVIGPGLSVISPRKLPQRATYLSRPGDLLLPRVYSALHKSVWVQETPHPFVASDAFALLQPHSREQGLTLLALLRHQILGEQLWALASGTTVRSIAVSKLNELQLPALPDKTIARLASGMEALLLAQTNVYFPGILIPLARYWAEVGYWRKRLHELTTEIHALIEQVLKG
ncbi:MAG: hypothetical protein IPM39_19410 [Chloroflexi bacterium]|nr:hypothetical protein [Chloroflexota bacterium]